MAESDVREGQCDIEVGCRGGVLSRLDVKRESASSRIGRRDIVMLEWDAKEERC